MLARPCGVTAGRRPLGVFAHLEHDVDSARPELRLLLDTDGTWDGLVPIPVYLDQPTLAAAVDSYLEVVQRRLQELRELDAGEAAALVAQRAVVEQQGLAAFAVLPLVVALGAPDAVITDPAAQAPPPMPAAAVAGRWRPATGTRLWEVHHPRRPTLRALPGGLPPAQR